MAITVTTTNDTDVTTGVDRVKVEILWTTVTVPTTVTIYRETAGERHVVRDAAPLALSAGVGVSYDYEAPLDTESRWIVSNGVLEGASTPMTPTNSTSLPWLIHPGRPKESVTLKVIEWPSLTRPIEATTFQPIGRKFAVSVSSVRQSPRGTLVVYTENAAAKAAMIRVLADGVPLLVKGTPTENAGAYWISARDVEETPHEEDLEGFSTWTIPFVVVDEPTGDALPEVTYANASAVFTSYADALTKAPTFSDRTAGLWL